MGQQANTVTIQGAGVPGGTCVFIMRYINNLNGDFYSCNPATSNWIKIGPGAGGGSQHQVNGVNLLSNDPINFVDSASVTWSNPAAGNVVATAVGAGFPRLDQVTDPNVAKTFNLGANNLAFTNGKLTTGTGTADHQFNVYCTTNDCVGINSTGVDSDSMLHIKNTGVQGPFFDFWSSVDRWAYGVGSAGNFDFRTSNVGTDPINGTNIMRVAPTGHFDFLGPINYCAPASASGTAYTCTTNLGGAPIVGTRLTFVPDVDSGASPTLDVNGAGAAGIYRLGGTVAVGTTELKANKPFVLTYDAAGHWDTADLNVSASGTTVKVNGIDLTTQSPVNFQDSATVTWANPSAGNITATAAGATLPRLDQVLDPNADKDFNVSTHKLSFGNAAVGSFSANAQADMVGNYRFRSLGTGLGYSDWGFSFTAEKTDGSSYGIQSYALTSGSNKAQALTSQSEIPSGDSGIAEALSTGCVTSGGTNVGCYGHYVESPVASNGGTYLENYGVYIADQTSATGASLNYSLYTVGTTPSHFGGTTDAFRFKSSGAALVSGDFTVGAGWGNTASIGSIRGTDQAFSATITANGTGIADSPTLALTFKNGTWTTVPVFVCKQTGGTGIISDIKQAETATSITLTWLATATATKTYTFSCVGMGI